MTSIPIIDLASIHCTDDTLPKSEDSAWIAAADKIREGLGAVGFLYLVNHGIPRDVISKVFSQSHAFFHLPNDVKLKYKKDTSKLLNFFNFYGYLSRGGELINAKSKHELRESYDWLIGRGIYPNDELPNFEPSIIELDFHCKQLLKKLLRLLAIGLRLEDTDHFLKACRHFDEPENVSGLYNLKLLHYPPVLEGEGGPGVVRCGEHTDAQLLTLLFQDDVGGLEIKTVEGEWIQASPIPGSILVNTGDLIEFWTCGLFPATVHRISTPKIDDSRRHKSRYSIAFFNGPDVDAVITPVKVESNAEELERHGRSGKNGYSLQPMKALDHLVKRVAAIYEDATYE